MTVASIVSLLILACVFGYGIYGDKIYIRKNERAGTEIIARFEAYRELHGDYPDTYSAFSDIGMTESDLFGGMASDVNGTLFCYQKESDDYMLWFGTGVGEGHYYRSWTEEWTDF